MGNLEERSLWRRALGAYRRGLWLGLVSFERAHGLVEGIALDRLLPCPTGQRDDFVVREPHRRWRAGFVIDALEHDRSLEVVTPEGQGDLGNKGRHHRPVRLHVRNVVEQDPADGDVLEVVESGRRCARASELLAELVVIGVIGEWNVGQEATGLVLQSTEREQVIDAILAWLDVTI